MHQQRFWFPRVVRWRSVRGPWSHRPQQLSPSRGTVSPCLSSNEDSLEWTVVGQRNIGGFQDRRLSTANSNRPPTKARPPPAKSLSEAFKTATLYSDNHRTYKLVRFPRASVDVALELWTKSARTSAFFSGETTAAVPSSPPPFGCFMVDKDEITILVSSDVYQEYYCTDSNGEGNDVRTGDGTPMFDNGIDYRLFTFDDVELDPSLVGFMAVITRVLAENDISVLPYAAYSTDHLLVAETDAKKAQKILKGLWKRSFPATSMGDGS